MLFAHREKQSLESFPEEAQILDLLDKDFFYYKMFKELKEKLQRIKWKYEKNVSLNREYQQIEIIKNK